MLVQSNNILPTVDILSLTVAASYFFRAPRGLENAEQLLASRGLCSTESRCILRRLRTWMRAAQCALTRTDLQELEVACVSCIYKI
jgi:hypothetical protein